MAEASLPIPALLSLFVVLVIFGDFAISGMLSKFGILAPIFIPMFIVIGSSPELTTAAYRVGDSGLNIVTPSQAGVLRVSVWVTGAFRAHDVQKQVVERTATPDARCPCGRGHRKHECTIFPDSTPCATPIGG